MKNRDHAIVDKVFMGLIDRWDRDERASRVMTMIQVVIMEIENTQLPIFKSKTVLQKNHTNSNTNQIGRSMLDAVGLVETGM